MERVKEKKCALRTLNAKLAGSRSWRRRETGRNHERAAFLFFFRRCGLLTAAPLITRTQKRRLRTQTSCCSSKLNAPMYPCVLRSSLTRSCGSERSLKSKRLFADGDHHHHREFGRSRLCCPSLATLCSLPTATRALSPYFVHDGLRKTHMLCPSPFPSTGSTAPKGERRRGKGRTKKPPRRRSSSHPQLPLQLHVDSQPCRTLMATTARRPTRRTSGRPWN
jgi:hypothetical protein